jgi:hypothetical protein
VVVLGSFVEDVRGGRSSRIGDGFVELAASLREERDLFRSGSFMDSRSEEDCLPFSWKAMWGVDP